MKVTDLRIGNYVIAPLGEIMKVTVLGDINNPDYIKAEYKNGFGQNGFEGIPLTPEILEKCGFEKRIYNNWTVSGKEYTIQIGNDGFSLLLGWHSSAEKWTDFKIIGNGCYDEAGEMSINETCKHLHQLQNLYYFLVGEELPVNFT